MTPPDTEDSAFAPTASRPASPWPHTTGAGVGRAHSSSFAPTRFDPAADAQARADVQAAAAFDVCHPALALRAVLLVQTVLAISALVLAGSVADWATRQAAHAFAGVAGTLIWLVGVCALKPLFKRLPPHARALPVLALGAAAALAGWWPLWALGLAGDGGVLRVGGLALTGAGLAALLWAWLDLRARIRYPADAQARLAELQSRIRPHFLFNALNTALALVRVDPARAERVLEDLAQLFRVALADTSSAVALAEEIELAKAYLAIEKVRFGARLQVVWEIDPRATEARVPPLVLQPLVENAVRHGIEPAAEGGQLWVRAEVQRGQAVVTVSNTVPDEPPSPGHGMALHNVRERLRLLHDVAASCEVGRDGALFRVRIVLPLN